MPFAEYLYIIKRILASIQIPLSVDIEMGYGSTADEIFANIQKLTDLGVAGINIEDSVISNSGRTLQEATTFANKLEQIKNKLISKNIDLFVNIRCDTFLLNVANKQEETRNRTKLYEERGADGIFLPGINSEHDITDAVHHTNLPVNVMCIPGLPNFETLKRLGVKRVSMGGFFFNKAYANIGLLSKTIIKDNNFSSILS